MALACISDADRVEVHSLGRRQSSGIKRKAVMVFAVRQDDKVGVLVFDLPEAFQDLADSGADGRSITNHGLRIHFIQTFEKKWVVHRHR